MQPQNKIIFIVGPTAVGKTEIALSLAEKASAEIVSCDALQVYREVNIASDKPKEADLSRIPHHCINITSVTEHFDVAQYRQAAVKSIGDIQSRGKLPLVVGGSGMYMSVLLDGIFEGTKDEELRKQLDEELKLKGSAALHERLKELDAKSAEKIHPNDPQRILRALEVVISTGEPLSELQNKRQGLWGSQPITIFAINRDRGENYRRAEARIDQMFERGLVEEVKGLLKLSLSRTASAMIGIPEVKGYLNGEYNLERAKYLMKLNTRHYIKRQLTWFRRDERLQWIDIGESTALEIAQRIADLST